jgi:branched-subunit amino acid aminotransferase/4-amino-4-deoxychorismate lyase
MTPVCYLNGRFIEVRRAAVPATDRGLLYGEGLFETWRTYKGHPFAVGDHLVRLAHAARALGIPFDAAENWHERTRELVRRNRMHGRASVVRLTVTRGSGPIQLTADRTARPTRLMLLRPLEPGLREARARGVAVHLFDVDGGAGSGLRTLKTLNYLPAVIGKRAAAARGCFESIYRLPDSTLLEGTTSNLFVVRGRTVMTPPIAAGILPGVTRAIVLRLARRVATVKEARITNATLLASDEAFLTSTSIEIVPIVRIGRRRAAGGRPGPLTRELQDRYRRHVAKRLGMDVAQLGE